MQDGTSEPAVAEPLEQNCTNDTPPRTSDPEPTETVPTTHTMQQTACTPEPGARLNRHQRRALAALQRRQAA